MQSDSGDFYDTVPVFNRFSGIMDPGRYRDLIADIVQLVENPPDASRPVVAALQPSGSRSS